jgi:hypothetical protein
MTDRHLPPISPDDDKEVSGVHSLDDLARKVVAQIKRSEVVAKKGDRTAMFVSVMSLVATVTVIIGGWVFVFGSTAAQVEAHEDRIKSLEMRINNVATKDDVRDVATQIGKLRDDITAILMADRQANGHRR